MKDFEFFEKFWNKFRESSDIFVRDIEIAKTPAKIVYVQSLVDASLVQNGFLSPILKIESLPNNNKLNFLFENALSASSASIETEIKTLEHDLLSGSALLFVKNELGAIDFSAQGFEKRSIAEPPTSAVIKGPREGFTEDLSTNLSMLRRRLKTSNFVVKKQTIGLQSQTDVCICYLSNIADECVVKEVERRLSAINIDGIVDSYYIEEMLSEKSNTIFKQVGSSEKPDVVMSKLLEGRVAIVVDGSPIVLSVPFLLIEDLQSGDDYYSYSARATFLRFMRIFGMLIGVLLPGIYVATQIFHYRLLPMSFLISLLDSVSGLVFPPLIEILFVLFLFEILNEASVRMPKHLGMALSVIGALVLGDTAVQAGLISPTAILVIAISGITIYTVPDQVQTLSLIRLFFTIIGGIAGFYGILTSSVFVIFYIVGFGSFGTPYTAPYAPYIKDDCKDALTKRNLRFMKTRPKSIPNKNQTRLVDSQKTQEEGA